MNISQRRGHPAAGNQQREEAFRNSPTIAERFPRAGGFAIEMAFRDPRGGTPSPRRQSYEPSMQAFFTARCPIRDCTGGGFDFNEAIQPMLSEAGAPRSGNAVCHGARSSKPCDLELSWSLVG